MSQDEVEHAMQLLIEYAKSIHLCPYCGYPVYINGWIYGPGWMYGPGWAYQHSPIVRVHDGRIEAGFFCGISRNEVIVFIKEIKSGGRTKVDKGGRTKIFG